MSLLVYSILCLPLMLASLLTLDATASHVQLSTGDSLAGRKYAERLQQRFERLRRQHLPWTYGSSGRCDMRIGQYCFTFDDDDRHWEPPPDHPDVVRARDELVKTLDSLWAESSGDEWILTQLVRYSAESDRLDLAEHAIASCVIADRWLCHALAGYVDYLTNAYESSEHAFDRALDLMTAEQRCEWEDVSDLITGSLRGRWRDSDCSDRSGLRDTLFWLADPLYSVPGNELRAEHFARHVVSIMYRQARGPDLERWNAVTHEIMMRYGWPIGWQRSNAYRTSPRPPMVTHYGTKGSATFFPTAEMVRNPTSIEPGSWNIDPDRPQSSHGPPYASESFGELDTDLSMFRRGDSTVVINVASVSHTVIPSGGQIEFAMAVTSDPYHAPRVWSEKVADSTHVLSGTVAAVPQLVSVEALGMDTAMAARTRFGSDFGRLHRPGLVASDLLVLDPVDSLPDSLSAAIAHIRRPHPYRAGERFVLYWELYGMQAGDSYATSLSLDKTSKGFFRRLAELTPLASHQPAVRVEWDEASRNQDRIAARSLSVDLPEELSDGRYTLTLTIETTSGQRVERRTELRVRKP